MNAIRGQQSAEALASIREQWGQASVTLRMHLVRLLRAMDDPGAVELLTEALSDRST